MQTLTTLIQWSAIAVVAYVGVTTLMVGSTFA
jgi:hypothetical protein